MVEACRVILADLKLPPLDLAPGVQCALADIKCGVEQVRNGRHVSHKSGDVLN
jgi:hypothetical protein